MLSEWQKNVDKYIPPQLSGYDFICRVPVYIPVQEIGLTVWERRVQVLSFVQECVLTAIRIGSKSLPDLADQFGLPESIMLQIVSQLDSEQLTAVSCGDIVLTDLGKKVLESQKKVKTLRSQLSRISVNQITGEVSDTPLLGTYREPPRGQAYLFTGSFCRFCRKAVKEKAALRRSFLYCLPVGILADLHDPQDGLDFAHAVVSVVSEQATATIVFAQVALLTECRRAEPTKIPVGVGHKNCHLFSPFLFIVILARAPHRSL